jgi:hypothetical protein
MEGDGIGERVPPAGVGGRREKAAAGEPGEERAAAGEPGEKSGERPGVGDPRPEPARGGIEEEATTRGRPEEGPRAEEPEPAGWNPGAARRDIEALVRQVVEQRERQAPQRQAPQRKAAPEKAAGMAGLAAGIESRLRHLEERLRVNRDGG